MQQRECGMCGICAFSKVFQVQTRLPLCSIASIAPSVLLLSPLTLCGADCNRNIDFNANFSVENGNFIKSGKLMNGSSCTFNFSLLSGNEKLAKEIK